eukprot:4115411-Amphidinium_carterae.1
MSHVRLDIVDKRACNAYNVARNSATSALVRTKVGRTTAMHGLTSAPREYDESSGCQHWFH